MQSVIVGSVPLAKGIASSNQIENSSVPAYEVSMPDTPISDEQAIYRQTENLYHCLSPCAECSGSYVSDILGKRFLCHCKCHGGLAEDEHLERGEQGR